MANETQKSPQTEKEVIQEPLPEVLFPSPIADEYFDPYTDPQDRADYVRLGGSQDTILAYNSVRKIRELQGHGAGYPDREEAIQSILDNQDRKEKQQRIEEAIKRSKE